MASIYIKELKHYTFDEIIKKLNLSNNKNLGKEIINRLKSYGILKSINKNSVDKDLSNLDNEEIDILENEEENSSVLYVFKFVGVITINNYVFICYPKYISKTNRPEEEMKQILKVIKKYNSGEQVISLYNGDSEEKSFNYLAIILYLINDYYDNGIYYSHRDIIGINDEGDILWDKTINETDAYIDKNRPYYLELYTKKSVEDNSNYFTKLHKFILTECFNMLVKAQINELLDIEEINLFDGDIEEFGDEEYILYRIEKELEVQYITQKQTILRTLYAYIAHRKANEYGIGISFYGTNHFNLVWEKVCANVLDNKLNVKIKDLPLGLMGEFKSRGEETLSELIDKPIWKKYDGEQERKAHKTLTPDLVSVFKIEKGYGFAIFDAKYYNIKFTKNKVLGQPGVGDVTKQYLYQLAYRNFVVENGYEFITNAFLVPSENEIVKNIGQAKMDILARVNKQELKNIEIIELPTIIMYELFIKDKYIDINCIIPMQINYSNQKNRLNVKYPCNLMGNLEARLIYNGIKNILNENIYIDLKYKDVEMQETEYIEENLIEVREVLEELGDIAIKLDNIFKHESDIDLKIILENLQELLKNTEIQNLLLNDLEIISKMAKKIYKIYVEYYKVMFWE